MSAPVTTIVCPVCELSRDIPKDRLPEGRIRVTCPRCREVFSWPDSSREGGSETADQKLTTARATGQEVRTSHSGSKAERAGFWLRFVAAMIDTFLISVTQAALGALLNISVYAFLADTPDRALKMFILGLFNFALWQTYKVFFTGYCGQTPGKMALRIKVVRTDYKEVGFLRAFWREVVGKFLSTLFFGLGFLLIAVDPGKQGLHDRLAATYVVKL